MSTCAHQTMTNHHAEGLFSRVGEALRTWQARSHQRRELAHWTERDLHDVGLSWADVMYEAEKPFWRA